MDIPRTRDEVQDGLEAITNQINDGLEKGRYNLTQLQNMLSQRTREAAASTDRLVHDYPWSAIAVGVGIGMMLALLLPRRR